MFGLACVAVALALTVAASPVIAGPVLNDPETWSGGLNGWESETGKASLDAASGYLEITFGPQLFGGPPQYEEDTIHTHSADETGNFQIADLAVRFSFFAEDVLPLNSAVYLHQSGAPADEHWAYAFANTGVGSWQNQAVSFNYSANWVGPGGAAAFWTALANVDWIGINIARRLDKIQQDYRLDNWEYGIDSNLYSIPEPGTYCMLASALLSVAFTFRKRLGGKDACPTK